MELGTKFVTLLDCCLFATNGDRFLELIREIKDTVTRLGLYPANKEVKEATDKWMSIFQGLKPSEPVSQEIRDRLRAEVEPWRMACQDAMGK
jgi:hypothetical protein